MMPLWSACNEFKNVFLLDFKNQHQRRTTILDQSTMTTSHDVWYPYEDEGAFYVAVKMPQIDRDSIRVTCQFDQWTQVLHVTLWDIEVNIFEISRSFELGYDIEANFLASSSPGFRHIEVTKRVQPYHHEVSIMSRAWPTQGDQSANHYPNYQGPDQDHHEPFVNHYPSYEAPDQDHHETFENYYPNYQEPDQNHREVFGNIFHPIPENTLRNMELSETSEQY